MTTLADNNAIRKAAILFRTLEPESAAVLLTQLSQAEARAVRAAIRELGDVSDEERQHVATEMLEQADATNASTNQEPADHEFASQGQAGVELELSGYDATPVAEPGETTLPDDVYHALGPTSSTTNPPEPAPEPTEQQGVASLARLADADASTLADYLGRENPSVVALVLSYLPAERAAEVLDELPFDLRGVALEHLANLGDVDEASLEVLASDLGDWIGKQTQERQRQASRLATIDAILGATAASTRGQLLKRLDEQGCRWVNRLRNQCSPTVDTEQAESAPAESRATEAAPTKAAPTEPAPTEPAPTEPAPTEPSQPREPAIRANDIATDNQPQPPVVETSNPRPPALPFSSFHRLDIHVLAAVMRRVPARQLLLALAGADEGLQRRIESLIPARQARELRRRLESLGPTTLREVEAAQTAMAQVAAELVGRNRIARR